MRAQSARPSNRVPTAPSGGNYATRSQDGANRLSCAKTLKIITRVSALDTVEVPINYFAPPNIIVYESLEFRSNLVTKHAVIADVETCA
eukprot:3802552-Pyramimonas_sp.AAC.1